MECLPLPVESLREECFTFLQATLTDDSLWHAQHTGESGRNTFGKARDESLVLICGGGAEWVRFELSLLQPPLQPQTYAWPDEHGFKMLDTSRLRHAA